MPRCPAAASLWRRVRPTSTGRWTFTADGTDAATLSVFTGASPAPDSALGCVDRQGPGPLVLPVPARKGRLLWVRIGTDRPVPGAVSQLRFRHAVASDRLDGGACLPSVVRPGVAGGFVGPAAAKAANRSRIVLLRLRVAHGPLCAARLTLTGPGSATFARGTAGIVRGIQQVGLERVRKLRRGRYRLHVDALGVGAIRSPVHRRDPAHYGGGPRLRGRGLDDISAAAL